MSHDDDNDYVDIGICRCNRLLIFDRLNYGDKLFVGRMIMEYCMINLL